MMQTAKSTILTIVIYAAERQLRGHCKYGFIQIMLDRLVIEKLRAPSTDLERHHLPLQPPVTRPKSCEGVRVNGALGIL